MKKQLLTLLVLFTTIFMTNAQQTVAGVKVENKISVDGKSLTLNGVGTRVKLFMDMYVGALYLETKNNNASEIMSSKDAAAIKLNIVSGLITSDKMINAIDEGFKNSTGGKQASYKAKIDKFKAFFKEEIKKGDVFVIAYLPEDGIVVYKNGTKKGTIDGHDFKKALFGIWLSDKPADSKLKAKMLGK